MEPSSKVVEDVSDKEDEFYRQMFEFTCAGFGVTESLREQLGSSQAFRRFCEELKNWEFK